MAIAKVRIPNRITASQLARNARRTRRQPPLRATVIRPTFYTSEAGSELASANIKANPYRAYRGGAAPRVASPPESDGAEAVTPVPFGRRADGARLMRQLAGAVKIPLSQP